MSRPPRATTRPTLPVLLLVAAAPACGGTVVFEEDDGGAGGAGRSPTSSAITSAAPASNASSSSGDGGFDSGVTVQASSAAITVGSSASASGSGGCQITGDSPCADVCQCDPGCSFDPPDPATPCTRCVQAEASKATNSECAVEGALGPGCQRDVECSDYITCVIGGGLDCDFEYPEGAERARREILRTCGDCGSDTTFPRD